MTWSNWSSVIFRIVASRGHARGDLDAELFGSGLCGGAVEIGDHHLRALRHEARGDGEADALSTSGDDRGLVREKFHSSFPFWSCATVCVAITLRRLSGIFSGPSLPPGVRSDPILLPPLTID
ncbi:hypothetical protein J2S40_002740 [Nocardioides luteus]|uniref:Uncharacterized protein n=1 Tax=Nocardioides luteus TaxID=1844 RepID=A0ABQ5T2D3_9ACTN|nr:hypothetical protein [Nocardioides luteus]GGR72491.1 hypothetical protein GCM10010197_44850 [Nocardioides luteus]GLJ70020.1 hypothetical protein GCM10017579_40560 [Nocardioides luteus]